MSMWECLACENTAHDEDCDEGERCPVCQSNAMRHLPPREYQVGEPGDDYRTTRMADDA